MLTLHAPRIDAPVDLEEHLARMPVDACTKGMFFNALLDRGVTRRPREELLSAAGLPASTRFLAFRDYPMTANLRLTVAVASALFPRQSLASALRELGRDSVSVFRESHVGRVFLDTVELEPETLFRLTPRIYRTVFNFGELTLQAADHHSARFAIRGMPIFIETYQVGALESALKLCKRSGEAALALDGVDRGVIEVRWR